MSEQDESADMQTDDQQREAEGRAHRRNDPKLHRPQQVVSFLDGLVGEDASLSTVRGSACPRHNTCYEVRAGPNISYTSVKTQAFVCKLIL